ncbi:type IV secretory system conjugative DNA transfer family protein [Saccharopolyspora pogona]|uniref:type IV secretory system conjugative DNA transfer family protein n=1 Tax=Saccharopolyspora pogona TaxID=333966 RepID=UPI001CC26DE2|nr:type IV secretory system conjugative DNA transfer family protein [Saccharopolyspora pogona]
MNTRRSATAALYIPLPLWLLLAFGVVSLVVWGAVALGGLAAGTPITSNPVTVVLGLAMGTVTWPGSWGWVVLVVELGVLVGLGVVVARVRGRRGGKTSVDRSARSMGHPADLTPYSADGVAASAQRLRPGGVDLANPDEHGVLIGRTVVGRKDFRSSWEDTIVEIWGPRTGKTTSQAVPAIVAAPGAVLATSNKRDLHDATRGVRELVGKAWLFDPQDIVGLPEPEFWVNPLDTVTGPREASELVAHFVAGSTSPDAKKDSYFDTEGENLLSYFFLAAARSGKDITAAYHWAADSRNREPAEILRDAGDIVASKLAGIVELPEKQREGVYASALRLLKCLEDARVLKWVTPPTSWPEYADRPAEAPTIPQFDAKSFLQTRDTLYLLSKEGEGSASPLVAALTFAVLVAGEQLGRELPGARLDPPLLCVLDEAANVCRIRQLPNLYSHFGSRGMLVMTILQSWEQGVEAWGKSGMQKIWDSANVRVYGGGVADADFLDRLARLVGRDDELRWSRSYDRNGGSSRSVSPQRERILDVEHLAKLPRGRAVVVASGVPATMVEPVPWMAGPRAGEIRLSLATYDPGARN